MKLISRSRSFIGLVVTLGFLASPLVIWANRHAIYDWWRLHGYRPPAAITAYADQTTMTPLARHDLYINHPALVSDANSFHRDCPNSEQTIVLGCYLSVETGIYVYQIGDSRLKGVEQVTTAHETLHAAYERLSASDRKNVDGLLNNYYQHGLHDQRVIAVMKDYQKTEPNDLVNEMHSVFGTEIADLPPALEAYYQRYFSNRHAVVAFSASYEAEFTNRTNQIKADDTTLAGQKAAIEAQENNLQAQLAKLNSDRNHLDQLKSSGQIDDYNAGVAAFNAAVEAYNVGVSRLHSMIAAYNLLVTNRNAIASDLRQLTQAIDTRLSTQSGR